MLDCLYHTLGCPACGCCPCTCPAGPTGPQGATGPQGIPGPQGIQGPPGTTTSGLSAYGGRYQAGTQLVFFTAADIPVQINLNTPMPSRNISQTTNGLVIEQAGDYELTYNLLLSTSKAATVAAAARSNGTVLTQTRGSQTLSFDSATNISYDARLSATTILTLDQGSVIDLVLSVVRTLPANLDAAVNGFANATLTLKKLDPIVP